MARFGRRVPFRPHLQKPNIQYRPPQAPVWINDSATPIAAVSMPYSYTFYAAAVPAATYAVTSGSIPAGLTLNAATGVLAGTPTTGTSYTFVVTATNYLGSVDSPSQTIVVAASPGAPHYVTEIGIMPGSLTEWGPGGFVGLQEVILQRSDGLYVRYASIANPASLTDDADEAEAQDLTISDYEAFQQVGYTYNALVVVTFGPNQSVVSPTSVSNEATITTSSWWEIDPLNTSTAVAAQLISFEPQVTEQSTAHIVSGQQVPNIVANVMGGQDGTAEAWTKDSPTYLGFQAILQSQTTVFVSSPWGPTLGGYVRFGPQTGGMSSGSGNKVQDATLQQSVASAPVFTTAVTWVAQLRPPV